MKDEIKEILDFLKDNLYMSGGYKSLHYKQCDLLLDYITNLKQENERLKEIKPCMLNFQECYVVKDYKSRLEKASEYINNHLYMESTAGIQHPTFDGKPSYDFDCFDLLNILQNGSDKE